MSAAGVEGGAAEEVALAWRRDLHVHPEVGFTEFRTASRVAGTLADLGWDVVTGPAAMAPGERLGVPGEAELDAAYERAAATGADPRFLPTMRGGHTAVVATLRGSHPGRAVGLRADLDALPITESTDPAHRPARLGYPSAFPGSMHACGHDGHIGMAVELAHRLAAGRLRHDLLPTGRGGRARRAGGGGLRAGRHDRPARRRAPRALAAHRGARAVDRRAAGQLQAARGVPGARRARLPRPAGRPQRAARRGV